MTVLFTCQISPIIITIFSQVISVVSNEREPSAATLVHFCIQGIRRGRGREGRGREGREGRGEKHLWIFGYVRHIPNPPLLDNWSCYKMNVSLASLSDHVNFYSTDVLLL